MLGNFWFVLLIGVLIGAIIGGAIAGLVFYRIGYNRMRDKVYEETRRTRLIISNH